MRLIGGGVGMQPVVEYDYHVETLYYVPVHRITGVERAPCGPVRPSQNMHLEYVERFHARPAEYRMLQLSHGSRVLADLGACSIPGVAMDDFTRRANA
jgi:hypothetical protein